MDVVSLSPPHRAPSVGPAAKLPALPGRYRGPSTPLIRVAFVVVSLLLLMAVGTIGFRITEGWPWFKAFYGTLMTISTLGSDPVNQLSERGQAFNVVLITMGVLTVGFAIATLTSAVIESELGFFFGRRRMEKDIAKLQGHIIICGAGRVGRRVAQEVTARGIPIVIIENDPAKAQWALDRNYLVIVGDATDEAVLRRAHIEQARGLASAVTSDAQNVYIVLTARGMAPHLPIMARASEEAAESKLMKAGATAVLSPYSFTGQRMAHMLTRPNVQRFLDLALSSLSESELDIQIEEVRIAENSSLLGARRVATDMCRDLGVIVLAVRTKDGAIHFNPGPEHPISAGDFLIAIGDSRRLKELETLAGV